VKKEWPCFTKMWDNFRENTTVKLITETRFIKLKEWITTPSTLSEILQGI
jgi:hypothetical protein